MTKMIFALLSPFLLLLPSTNENGMISETELSLLTNYLELTETNLVGTIETTDEEDWYYNPGDDVWSAAQCMQHILVAEMGLMKQIKKALNEPAQIKPELRKKDAWLIAKVNDRGVKVKTSLDNNPEAISQADAIAQLKASRERIREFLKDKTLPLRHHLGRSPYGPVDCYQLLLVVGAHSMRHHHQILEVLAGR